MIPKAKHRCCELTGGQAWTERLTGHGVVVGVPRVHPLEENTLAGAEKNQQELNRKGIPSPMCPRREAWERPQQQT